MEKRVAPTQQIRRRELILGLGGAALGWPLAAYGESRPMPIVGYLAGVPFPTSGSGRKNTAAFLSTLAEYGYVDGQNLTVIYRSADNDYARLPTLAADLMKDNPTVIAMPSGLSDGKNVIGITGSVPIVFLTAGDPVAVGLVPSFNRPGGKFTGVVYPTTGLVAKQFELLNELRPGAAPLAIVNDLNAGTKFAEAARKAAADLGRNLVITDVRNATDFEDAFVRITKAKAAGLVVPGGPLLVTQHDKLATLAARFALPAIYPSGDLELSAGLMSYGPSLPGLFQQMGTYVAKIILGVSAADLPIVQADRIPFVINLKTAKALGLTIPPTLLARADEVIE